MVSLLFAQVREVRSRRGTWKEDFIVDRSIVLFQLAIRLVAVCGLLLSLSYGSVFRGRFPLSSTSRTDDEVLSLRVWIAGALGRFVY